VVVEICLNITRAVRSAAGCDLIEVNEVGQPVGQKNETTVYFLSSFGPKERGD
jgi:hypothetical protein